MKEEIITLPAMDRRGFVALASGASAAVAAPSLFAAAGNAGDELDVWQKETDLVSPEVYSAYMRDGDARGLAALEKLEAAFVRLLEGIETAKVGETPAVWSVYNMGYVVKTREALFSIDLVHRRAAELAPKLDFALVTHNHSDHFRMDFYRAMDSAGKTVISNFLDNYGAADWRRPGRDWMANGGYTRAEKTFRIKDVEIRTSLVDHNSYLVDFTTAFEIRAGKWLMYHTGDCGDGSEGKLGTVWGRPDLWTFFPGCGIDVAKAVRRVNPKRVVFGHLWELGHAKGRLTTAMVRRALVKAGSTGLEDVSAALWGDRIS